MKNKFRMTTLTFIWHDCFVYQRDNLLLIFDYWKDPMSVDSDFPLFIKNAGKDLKVYVFVSHHHKDHFNPAIFKWEKKFKFIKFVLSYDTAKFCRHILNPSSIYSGFKPDVENIIVVNPNQNIELPDLSVHSFGSTDIGVSFAVREKGKVIFHAGDLNAWLWKDESTEEEIEQALSDYRNILNEITSKFPMIDYAMFPVDSRIGTDYETGAKMFVRMIDVKYFFPMHFGLGEKMEENLRFISDASRFDLYANPERGEYVLFNSPYSGICLTK